VYENIIADLRAEIEKANSKYLETNRRLEEAVKASAKLDQLEEEILIYKDMAKNISVENQRL
jgi:hypothetical protein